jgi:hypothetical protein
VPLRGCPAHKAGFPPQGFYLLAFSIPGPHPSVRAIPAAWENRYEVCRKATGQLPSVILGAGFIRKPRGQATDMRNRPRRVTPSLFSPGLGKGGFWVIYNKAEGFP